MSDMDERRREREARRAARRERLADEETPRRTSLRRESEDVESQRQEEESRKKEEEEQEQREKEEAEAREKERIRKMEEEQEYQEEQERRRRDEEQRKEEVAQERQRKKEEKAMKEQQEASKASKKKVQGKRKGLGGLSPEKKKLLKQLIMTKAAEEMKAEARRRAEAKENHLKEKLGTFNIEGLSEGELQKFCKDFQKRLVALEEEKYDWEVKLRRQDQEINELNLKVNDVKGKFVKPVLKKVNKTESKLARFEKKRDTGSLAEFRNQLKSTGQNKYALEEKDEGHKNPDWRDHLKSAKEGEHEGEQEGGEGGGIENSETAAEAVVELDE